MKNNKKRKRQRTSELIVDSVRDCLQPKCLFWSEDACLRKTKTKTKRKRRENKTDLYISIYIKMKKSRKEERKGITEVYDLVYIHGS